MLMIKQFAQEIKRTIDNYFLANHLRLVAKTV